MGPLRVSNVLRPDNRVAAGPWVGWAHGGVCSVCSLVLLWHVLRAVGPEGLLWLSVGACPVGVWK